MEAVIFVGIPASGKSTYYQQQFFNTHVRINLDMLKTRHREQAFMQVCLQTRQRFVVDNTNVTRAERARYILPARAAGFRVIGYFFQTTLGASIERSRGRAAPHPVPVQGIAAKFHLLQIPILEEGFDELHRVTIEAEGGFSTTDYVP